MDIHWYLNRLKRMSAPEMLYRVRQIGGAQLQKRGLFRADSPPTPDFNGSVHAVNYADIQVDRQSYIEAAEAILDGRLDVFAKKNCKIDFPPAWNRDPLTEITAPLTHGKTLNYRDESLVGNIKYLWEPSRHLHLVTLAQAYKLTDELKYFSGFKTLLSSWFEQCPYLMGPQWTSSLELAIRLINWSFAWQILGGQESPLWQNKDNQQFRDKWLESVYQHCDFIAGHFSRFSSANNHLIGEAAGLFVGASTWPYWGKMDPWRNLAQNILEEEALRQNGEDGVNLEQTTSYQQFVLDFLLIPAVTGKNNGISFSDDYWSRIKSMLQYLVAITDCDGNIPMIGDADDGYVVALSQEKNFCPYRSLVTTGAVLFSSGDLKGSIQNVDDKTQWLLGPDRCAEFGNLEVGHLQRRRAYPVGGYYILGTRLGEPEEVMAIIDAGPLGYQSIAAHGHADALSFVLNVAGQEVLIDPGTYSYHTEKIWRDYFRGTAAHNTIRIDGEDQSVIGGNFMWMEHAEAKVDTFTNCDKEDVFSGSHDGYTRLADPVIHRRKLCLDKLTNDIFVEDEITSLKEHYLEQFWHFSEFLDLDLDGHKLVIRGRDLSVTMTLDSRFSQIELVKGRDNPPAGWVSRSFDVKVPTNTLVCSLTIQSSIVLKTTIRIN
ncbi:hypothetical protein MNBD_GAMMA16-443 [hydrothermal vent metagenome]|uniref:Uncharacterized protein n=1 Tax=hydrothermal vent metagenome TaxID=652676 RepID=A0A3B0YQG3_9ZZZZ